MVRIRGCNVCNGEAREFEDCWPLQTPTHPEGREQPGEDVVTGADEQVQREREADDGTNGE